MEKRQKIKAAEPMPEYFHLLRRETKLSRLVKSIIDETGSDNVSRSSRCDENIPGGIGSEAASHYTVTRWYSLLYSSLIISNGGAFSF
jgi:hypothetical protein